jgi:hypothetical protein
MAFLAIPFAMTAGRAALSFGARAIAPVVERTLMPVATSVAREVTREAGMAVAQVVGQSAVDQISSTIHNTTSGPIGQAVGAVVTQAGSTAVAMASGDVVGVVRGTVNQVNNQVHLAQAVYTGLTTTSGSTHAETVQNSTNAQVQAAGVAAVAPGLTAPMAVGPYDGSPLPAAGAHDANQGVLAAQTPCSAAGPAATQGSPQPIRRGGIVAPGSVGEPAYQAREVEPQRVYNQDHAALLPPVTLLQTDQHQLRVTSDPPPPPQPHHRQHEQQQSSGSMMPIIAIGTVTVGGVLIFLWYRQRRA